MMEKITTEHKLRERVKELTCLYDVTSAVLQHGGNIEATLKKICRIVQSAYQYEDDAVIELWLESHYILTGVLEADTINQYSAIKVFSEELGFVKVHYSSNEHILSDFLHEEQLLLDKVAHEIGSFFEKLIITEREKLFQRNIAHTDRLAVLHEITAGIAHELNTPLGNILGFAELIQTGKISQQMHEDVSKIIKSAIYSREIVKKLMLFSGEVPAHPEEVDVKEAITQCLSILSPNFKKKELTFSFHYDDRPILTYIDSIYLTQIIFNLVLNAIYSSPEKASIYIELSQQNETIIITIADQGKGVPEKLRTKIFEPFFTTKPIGEGTGLGLSVVHGIVKKLCGDILLEDNNPTGAKFMIQLPLKNKQWD